jgi:DNA-binding GntR family transcriptional regulator
MTVENGVFTPVHLERASLKYQATELLRGMIVSGKLASGSKVTERDVATWLNISRMPARDALMELERQGLIVTRPGGRYVIELNEEDIRHLFRLRATLEKLAVELAVANASPVNQAALETKLAEMRRAIEAGNTATYTASDLEMHELIWQRAGNPYLLDMLNSMIGPIFMIIASQARMIEDWQESLRLHEQLVEAIGAQDLPAAVHSIDAHIRHSFDLALSAFQK